MEHAISYDRFGRMAYHPDYHPNHGQRFTEEELEYLCKFFEADGADGIALALGRTVKTILHKAYQLKKDGQFDYYKNLKKHYPW